MIVNFKPKRIIILGSTGYIGKYLLKRFLSDNFEVSGYSSSTCDLLSLEKARRVFSGFTDQDAVLMLSTINRLDDNSYDSMLKNIAMAENLSKLIGEYPVGLLVFFSTIDVYGISIEDDEIINENTLTEPNDYYSISKLASENLLRRACSKKNIILKILRLSGVYGQGDNGRSTISIMVNSAKEKNEIQIRGDGLALRDFVYIEDIYKIVISLVERSGYELFNVATGKSYSIIEIVDIIKGVVSYDFNIKFVDEVISNPEKRAKNLVFDISAMVKSLCGLILTDLRDGIPLYLSNSKEEEI